MDKGVNTLSDPSLSTLAALGWSASFADQISAEEAVLTPMRIATVHRTKITALSTEGTIRLYLPAHANTTDFAVGDWCLVSAEDKTFHRMLDRQSLLQRRTEGRGVPQLIAANINTLFIVTSCNDDFNPARLERYLALANEAEIMPVIVLTKIDQTDEIDRYRQQAEALQRDLPVIALNAKAANVADILVPWCGIGQTVALIGSSGVGKSTLINALSSKPPEEAQLTGGIRASDAKGRHTTTSRSLHAMDVGGWVIDTPGMRTLHVSDVANGLDVLFAEIVELAPQCRFRDCTHGHEPGCAVQAAIKAGNLDADRLDRWQKLQAENISNTPVQTGARGNKSAKSSRKRR